MVLYLYFVVATKTKKSSVPLPLLEMLTDWIESDSQLCLVSLNHAKSSYIAASRSSLWTSPTKPNTQTPIPGLVRWCTQSSLNQSTHAQHNGDSTHKHNTVWSKLHLAILQTLVAFPTIPGANQLELITLADMNRIIKEVVGLLKDTSGESDLVALAHKLEHESDMQLAVDRLVQILQVSVATGGFRCSLGEWPE